MIAQAEEQARQAIAAEEAAKLKEKMDAEERKKHEADELERERQEALEAERAQKKYEEELAAWEAAEAGRQLLEATEGIQHSLVTQDAHAVRTAIARWGHVLSAGSEQAQADLAIAKTYLEQLEQAAAAAAAEYNAAVGELHQAIYAPTVDAFGAGAELERLQAVAARASAAGAPPEMLNLAQEKANGLHAAHCELIQQRAQAEYALAEATQQLQTMGIAAMEPLRAANAYAQSLRLEGAVAEQAAQALVAAEQHEEYRQGELVAADAALRQAKADAEAVLAQAVASGEVLREFGAAEALRRSIARAQAAGVDHALVYEAGVQLIPTEAAERNHLGEVSVASEALHDALRGDSEKGLEASLAAAAYIRPYIDATLFNTAETRLEQFRHAHEVAQATSVLKKAMDTCEGPEGAEPLRVALTRAETAGVQGLLLRKAAARLNELQQLFEAAEREKEALEWMQAQEREQNALAEKRRVEEAAKEEDREARKAERKAKKEESANDDAEGDFLAKAAQAGAWESHQAPDGRTYYHNTVSGQTTWKRPPELDEPAAARQPSASTSDASGATRESAAMSMANAPPKLSSAKVASVKEPKAPKADADPAANLTNMSPKQLKKFLRARGVEHEDDIDHAALLALAVKSAHLQTVVWQKTKTADGKFYYFNCVTKATSWAKPADVYVS